MADDLDSLEDLFGDEPVKKARAVGKHRPKPKLQPQRKAAAKCSVASTQAVQTVHSALSDSREPLETGKPLKLSSDVLPNDKADLHAFVGKSVKENADVLVGSEAVADNLPHSNTECSNPPSEAVALDALNTENRGGSLGTQVSSSTNTHKADVPKNPGPSAEVDALAAGEPMVSSVDVHNDKDDRPGTEEMDVMDSINMTEFRTLPTESTCDLHLSEESMNLLEVPQLDSCTHMEGLPEIPAKLASRRAKTGNSITSAASDPHPQQQKTSTSSKENEAGRSLRPRKGKPNICELVDEDGDETIATGEFSEECPFSSAIDEENINSEQPQMENESQKKNLKRKSKKTENDKEKPPRKSKKAREASEQETHAKQKKFSHSTRRRRVDKNLLNIPEEEFDPRELSLRDLILLAEHRERQMKTDNAAAGAPETQKSAGNSTGLYNDEANNYGPDGDDDEGIPIAEDTTEYFNYQSRMEKTPRVRWSKQDTELFYEAVKQFGTDFSMIAQLFPGRSREQIRNKYKKEERQQPLMLREALTTRTKDLSYFEKVIEGLKQMRAKEEEDLDDSSYQGEDDDDNTKHEHVEEEESVDVVNDSSEAQNPPVKGEEKEKEKEEEVEVEAEEDEEEEDDLFWSQYKSDI